MKKVCIIALFCMIGCSQQGKDYASDPQLWIAYYTKSLQKNPQDGAALARRASVYYDIGKYQEVISDCNRVIELDQANQFAYNLRGCAFYVLGGDSNLSVALNDWRKTIELDSLYSSAIGNVGIIFEYKEQWDSALLYYDRSLAIKPDDTLVLDNRAGVLRKLGRSDEAILEVNRALELNPDYADAYWTRGNIYYDREEYTRCASDYYSYLALTGVTADAEVHCYLGRALEELGHISDAREQYIKAIERDSTYDYTYARLAGLYEDDGDVETAIRYYQTYLRLAPADDTAWIAYAKERLVALNGR